MLTASKQHNIGMLGLKCNDIMKEKYDLENPFTVSSGTLTCVLCRTTLMAKWNLLPPAPTLLFTTYSKKEHDI